MNRLVNRTDGLIYTQEFGMLLGRAQEAPIIRRELTEEYIPAGYTADEIWDALTVIRRSQAVVSPDVKHDNSANILGWYTVPDSLSHSLRQIALHTQRGSTLDVLADEQSGRRFVTHQYVQEMVTNLRLDGFPANYELAREALLEELPPAGDAQRLAWNYHRIMGDMADYAAIPYDSTLLRELYDRLVDSVQAVPSADRRHSPLEPFYVLDNNDDSQKLSAVADIANGLTTNPMEHPIMVSMLVNCQFWHYRMFDRCNNLMGCIASRLFLFRKGFPVFRYVPKIHLLWAWKTGQEYSPRGYSFDEARAYDGRNCVDWTAYYDTIMQLMLNNILDMESALGARKAVNDQALACIARLPGINRRQAEVLRRAVLNPAMEFRISWHQNEFDVVYSTARSDLEHLEKLGLFVRGISGSTYVYRPAPSLINRVARY